jgi:hypothetical protein
MSDQLEVRRYYIITNEEASRLNSNGDPELVPANTVVNVVMWDGVTTWSPPEGTRAEPANG